MLQKYKLKKHETGMEQEQEHTWSSCQKIGSKCSGDVAPLRQQPFPDPRLAP